MMARKVGFGFLVLALAGSLIVAGSSGLWLHVNVDEGGKNGEMVRVNLPLTLVETVLPLIQCEELKGGKVNLGKWIPDEIDVRGILEAIRDTEDAEFVTVEGSGETVRVVKEGAFLLVHVQEGDGEEKVDVKIPLKVVEALLSADGDKLDIVAAVQAIGEYTDGDLVTIQDGSTSVRVWIDSKNISR